MQTRMTRARRRVSGLLAGMALGLAAMTGVGTLAFTPAPAAAATAVQDRPLDELVLRNGRTVKGIITEETATAVKITVVYAGIEAPTSFSKTEILSIRRADRDGDAAKAADAPQEAKQPRSRRGQQDDTIALSGDRAPSVYHMAIKGELGSDIAVAPIRDVLEDAGRSDTNDRGEQTTPDYLIIELDRRWSDILGNDLGDDVAAFDEFSIVQGVIDLITKEMPQRWNKQPHVVVWVKSAMGGAAFIPFVGDTIVFHPTGRMGGIGNLSHMMEGEGDEVVRQKQRSLRLAMVQGLAIEGGYDYRLVTAMARMEYELSYRFNGGTVELLERTPENPGEFLLTENGMVPENIDSLRQRVDGTSDDVLTLREDTARHLGVSAGTASTLDDVLNILGIYRDHRMLDSRSEAILDNWSRSLKRAERELPKLWEEYNRVQVGGTFQETRRALGQRIRILEDIQQILSRFDGDQEYPALAWWRVGVPGPEALNVLIEQNRVQLIQTRP